MGQMGSSLSRSASHRRNARPPPPSPFLEWPVDLIRQHLSPVSALSLSLTCKSLSALASCQGGHTTPSIPDREEFLLLLEKDVGRTHSYCHTCSTLHPFSSSEPYALASSTWKLGEDDCRRRALVFFNGSGITLGYHHVRLAMDRHLFGPPNGLPLSKFNLPLPSQAPPCFRERWSARILRDEFFLSVTRTFDRHEMTDQQLRHAIDTYYHGICIHVDTAKRASHPIRGLHPGSSSSTGSSYLTPCREVVESCSQCLTDYETTVERRWVEVKDREKKKVRRAFWSITIASYHRLGAGRSPFDEKWHAFSLILFM